MSAQFDLGLRCGHFLSMAGGRAEVERDVFVGIEKSRIKKVCPYSDELRSQSRDFIDASGKAVMPGLVNAHTHLAMTLFRGLEDDVSFHKWLFERILPLEASMVDREFVRVGTELAALECIRFGVTTVADMYFFADTIAEIVDRVGLRGWIAQVCADGELPEDKVVGKDKIALFEALHAKYKDHERITAVIGPHAPYTCSDELLTKVARSANSLGAPIHTHISETRHEVDESLKLHGKTPVQRLKELGILGPRTLGAHCVHLDENDTSIYKAAGAAVAYNPDSNLKLGSGIAPITRYRKAGIPVAFGTDGAASNNDLSVFGAMDLGTKVQKLASGDNTAMTATDALACATIEGARAMKLDAQIGSLEVGKQADLIVIDLDYPHLRPLHDLRSHLVYALQGLEVDSTICAGRILMREKKILALDEKRIAKEAEAWKDRIQAAVEKM